MVDTGVADVVLPEVPRLRLETDEHMRHKDVYQHSLTVLEQSIELEERYGLEPDLVVRLAALLHDIGKPKTRSLLPDGRVAFHHHEAVGAAMARSRLKALRFPSAVVADVTTLIALHLRFHGYGPGEWTDSAVRRYVRDAGPLLTRLQVLTRADCTTRNKAKAARLARAQDGLEERIVHAQRRRRSSRRSGPTWTATRSWPSWACRPAARSAGPTSTCWTCGWSTARWAPSGPLRNCCAGRRVRDSGRRLPRTAADRSRRRVTAAGWPASTPPR